MNVLSPAARVFRFALAGYGMAVALPATAQVSHTYTAPPPPGYPASGGLKQPASTKATRQTAAAVQTPATYTYPSYPNSYPPPSGYTYPPPPGYGPPPKNSAHRPPTKPVAKKTSSSSKKSTPSATSTKVRHSTTTGDLSVQVAKIRANDKAQDARIRELERDVGNGRKSSGSSSPRYNGGSDILTAHTTHVVKPGDTLFRIASAHRVSVGEIQQINRLRSDEVHVGQTLLIPSPFHLRNSTVQVGYKPSTSGGNTRYSSSSTSTGHYIVKSGDSLKAIAIKHKITTVALANANGIKDANKIFVGQRLSIPGRTVVAARPSTTTPSRVVSNDTVPLPGYGVPSSYGPPPASAGLGLAPPPAPAPAPAPPAPAPVPVPVFPQSPPPAAAPTKPAASVQDTHRGILAYRVDRSDTLESIAQQFSTTPDQIRSMNHLQPGAPLKSGDEIMVPAMGAVSLR